jgi:fumarate reductase flavoprotein subunit
VVVGASLAGLCASIAAAERQATVIMLEKHTIAGGSTVRSGGMMAFAGTDEQTAAGVEDDVELLSSDLFSVGLGLNKPELVARYCEDQLDVYRWLKDKGIEYLPPQAAAGQSVARCHTADMPKVHAQLMQVATDLGVRIVLNARATRLAVDTSDGRATVAGVDAQIEGAPRTVIADLGVVLTTGGFTRDSELIAAFSPSMRAAGVLGGEVNTGDGLRMGWKLGANLRDMPYIKATFGNYTGEANGKRTDCLAVYKGAVAVNRDGKRYVDESIPYKLLGDACLTQPGRVAWQVFDQAVFDSGVPGAHVYDFDEKQADGWLIQADTLVELAEQAELPADTLIETISRYNDGARCGRDEEFGREHLSSTVGAITPIDTPPFYAHPSTAMVLATYCGLEIDRDARVVDVFGDPIPNLYAAGEVTGGFHGAGFMSGTSLGKASVFGRRAGLTVSHADA